MKILGIDTSTSVATVALMDDSKLICELSLNDKKTHSQKLMVLIDMMLKQTDTDLTDIDGIAVGVGPGSFTGLRIGVTTAKGLAHGSGLPVLEVSSLKALAQIGSTLPVCALMDSRRETVFTGIFPNHLDEQQIHIDELIDKCKSLGQVYFVGDGASLHHERIVDALGSNALFVPKAMNQLRAGHICELADLDLKKKYDDVHVTYLRKTQAERELEDK